MTDFPPPAATAAPERADVVLCGGGLANSLIALRLKARDPALKVLMLERASGPDDAHTWSFFATDVSSEILAWLEPLACARWPAYRVLFPGLERRVETPYASLNAAGLSAAVDRALGGDRRFGVEVAEVSPERVRAAADGRTFEAPLVIDGRGARPSPALALGFQKFVGLEVRTAAPHGLSEPTVMDATVPQLDGYRFVYVLPFAPDRLLIEDTRYSDGPALDVEELTRACLAYALERDWPVEAVERTETGVLPVALGGDIEAFWREQADGAPRVGMRAALFHPTTGYSLPDAARVAEAIAGAPSLTSAAVDALVRARSTSAWRERRYFRLLNRMMFLAGAPEQRWRVLARFYRLGRPLIERFYGARLTLADKARILAGEPPVPLRGALRAFPESAAFRSVHAA